MADLCLWYCAHEALSRRAVKYEDLADLSRKYFAGLAWNFCIDTKKGSLNISTTFPLQQGNTLHALKSIPLADLPNHPQKTLAKIDARMKEIDEEVREISERCRVYLERES